MKKEIEDRAGRDEIKEKTEKEKGKNSDRVSRDRKKMEDGNVSYRNEKWRQ